MKEMSATMIALIVTSILAVAGFVTVFGIIPFAQNSTAKGDLSNIAIAQEMSQALNGKYVGTIAALASSANGVTTGFVQSGGVKNALAANSAGTAYVAVTQSASGTFFARINGSTSVGQGDTIGAAMTAAGATSAWATAQGVTLPTAVA